MIANQFAHFASCLPEAMMVLNTEGSILSANPAARRHFLSEKKSGGDNDSLLSHVSDSPETVRKFLRRCARTRDMVLGALTWRRGEKSGPCRAEGALLRPQADGEEALLWLRLKPRESASRKFLSLNEQIGRLNHEIHARRRAEGALHDAASRLADADRRKDAFLATLAHELRNPLAPIRTGLEILRMKRKNSEETDEVHHIMERQLDQLVVLVDDLVDVSRITHGTLQIQKAPVSLAQIIGDAVSAVDGYIKAAGHQLEVNLPDAPAEIEADRHRLTQAVANLLHNAAKYIPPGGRIEVSAEHHDDDGARIRVRDNGPGIDKADRERIFDMFTQLDPPQGEIHSGLGVGLALVKTLAELHGGRVEVTTPAAGGSEFTIHLPNH